MTTLDQARAVAQRLRKNGEGCTCMAYGPTECACGAEWGHDYTDQGAVIIDALVAEVERLTHNNHVLNEALWQATGDDEQHVNAYIASNGELK